MPTPYPVGIWLEQLKFSSSLSLLKGCACFTWKLIEAKKKWIKDSDFIILRYYNRVNTQSFSTQWIHILHKNTTITQQKSLFTLKRLEACDDRVLARVVLWLADDLIHIKHKNWQEKSKAKRRWESYLIEIYFKCNRRALNSEMSLLLDKRARKVLSSFIRSDGGDPRP